MTRFKAFRSGCILALLLAGSPSAEAAETNAPVIGSPLMETFNAAQTAYDAGRYAEASLLYESILENGILNTEVRYNLANAYFKNAQLPEAVWHYRKAWYAAPRDPDIRANMHFALNAAGAIEPAPRLPEKLFSMLAKKEWILVAGGAYLLCMLLPSLGLLIRPARRIMGRLILLPVVLILIAAGGLLHWHQLAERPEWVVVKTGATALYGPVEGSTAHFGIPLAAIVRQHSPGPKGWVEIQYDAKSGWLKEEYIRRVSP